MDGVPLELINLKLAEKVNFKKRKLIKENKLIADEDENLEQGNKRRKKDKKNKEGKEIDIKTLLSKGTGFYHNPDSINLTLNQSQMSSMYNYGSGMMNNIVGNFQNQMGTEQMYMQQGIHAGQMGNPMMGQMGNPMMGNPMMGNPIMGNPMMGNPMTRQMGNPMMGQMGNPMTGQLHL